MKSNAATAEQYVASLPQDRREAISTVRRFIVDNLGPEFKECMQYGVMAYCVPHSIWPHGHHTRPELPLMYMGLSSQKNDMVVYMLFLLHNPREREWFDGAWKATGRKNHLEVSGAGCCLRFRKLEELSFDVIGEAMRRMPLKKYLEDHVAMLARIGKGPDGKAIKSRATKPAPQAASSRSGSKKPGAKTLGSGKLGATRPASRAKQASSGKHISKPGARGKTAARTKAARGRGR